MKVNVSKAQARKFLLKKQLLFSPQSLVGNEGMEKVFNTLRLVQYDPLNPCGRNVDLVLQARIKNYHPDDYYDWLYTEKKGIECYDKELCILPIEDLALSRLRQSEVQKRPDKKLFLIKHQKQIELLLQKIDKDGPISSSDIIDKTRIIGGWGDEARFGRIALETLWKMGRLVVVKRKNGKKYYDLLSRIHTSVDNEDKRYYLLTKEHVIRRLNSIGLLPKSLNGGGWQGLGSVKETGLITKELIKEEKIIEVDIKDCSRTYVVLQQDRQLLFDSYDFTEKDKKVIFLAPLDNLMWDREMIHELFNFYYRWEVYTPIHKRVYGYYVLPILYGDAFIGRIEPVLSKEKKLEIKGFWQEDKKLWNKKTWDAFEEGLDTFKNYLHATEIINSPIKYT